MKRFWLITMILAVGLLTACGSNEEPAEEAEVKVEEVEEQVEETEETEEAPPVQTKKEWNLDAEGRYKINIFLSNFSEQGFNEYDYVNNLENLKTFDVKEINADQLLEYSFTWHSINRPKSVVYEGDSMYLTIDQINESLQRYFGVTLSKDQIAGSGFSSDGNRVSKMAGFGASYPEISIIKSMTDNGDGTYHVEFGIFTVEESSTGGNIVADKSVYYMEYAEAVMVDGISSYGSGEAIVKPYKNGDIDSYNLIRYAVGVQEL